MLIIADMMPGEHTILFIRGIYKLQQSVFWAAVFSHLSLHLIFYISFWNESSEDQIVH